MLLLMTSHRPVLFTWSYLASLWNSKGNHFIQWVTFIPHPYHANSIAQLILIKLSNSHSGEKHHRLRSKWLSPYHIAAYQKHVRVWAFVQTRTHTLTHLCVKRWRPTAAFCMHFTKQKASDEAVNLSSIQQPSICAISCHLFTRTWWALALIFNWLKAELLNAASTQEHRSQRRFHPPWIAVMSRLLAN